MLRLHIVSPYQSVAMARMTGPLLDEGALPKLYEVTSSAEPDPAADINYHIPWHTLVGLERGTSRQVMLYTHCNPPDWSSLYDACQRADRIVCMSFQGRHELVELGVDPEKLWVIYAGANTFQFRRRNIGVIGAEQPNGRKRFHILLDLVWSMEPMDLSALNFFLVGNNLHQIADQLKNAGANVTHLENVQDDELQKVYAQLDVLLVTGYAEGGPLPFMEAYASGVPVLAPRIGYAADFAPLHSIYDGPEDLAVKLHYFLRDSLSNNLLTSALDWRQYVDEHALLIGRLAGTSAELQDGADRYAQLLDIIHETKAQRIVEIGTWNGARAVQMIQEAARAHPIGDVYYQGFDLFESMTGETYRREFSKQGWPVEIVMRRIHATGAKTQIIPGFTRETLHKYLLTGADLYFIDGGHSEETIKGDWHTVSERMQDSSVAVFDDYYHSEHLEGIGCNAVIDNLDPEKWCVVHLPVITETNGLRIGMVKVTKNAHLSVHGRTGTRSGSSAVDPGNWQVASVPTVWIGDVAQAAAIPGELERAPAASGGQPKPRRAKHDR